MRTKHYLLAALLAATSFSCSEDYEIPQPEDEKTESTNEPAETTDKLTLVWKGQPLTDFTKALDMAEGDLTYTAPEGAEVSARILEGEGWTASANNGTIDVFPAKLGESAWLEVTLAENGEAIETCRLTVTQSGLKGSGDESDPHPVSSAAELIYASEQTYLGETFADACFELTRDIDLTGTDFKQFYTFNGTLDGKGHTINGFYIEDIAEYTHLGMFRQMNGTIKNLNVEGTVHKVSKAANQTGSIHAIGGIVGISNGIVENCTFKGSVISDVNDALDCIGGVAGYVQNGGMVKGCAYLASADGRIDVARAQTTGGVVGMCHENSYTIGCFNTGHINYKHTEGSLGGVIGIVYRTYAVACYHSGTITAPEGADMCAGVVGNNAFDTGDVTACYSAIDSQTSQNVFLIGGTGVTTEEATAKFKACYWLNIEGRSAFGPDITPNVCIDCSAKTAEELKNQATVDALNAAVTEWNALHGNLCTYRFEADANGGYPVLANQN